MRDELLDKAVNIALYLMHNDHKNKVGLAIFKASEQTGVSTREISHQLHKIKQIKKFKEKDKLKI